MAETPRWAAPASGALAVGGLAVSSYLTWVHFDSPASLSCPNTGIVNCLKVTTSPSAYLLGIPVAVLGLLFFAGMAALCLPRAWRAEHRWISHGRIAGAVAGIGFAIYLVAAELLVVHALCLWCTAAHLIAFALFVVVLAAALHVPPELEPSVLDADDSRERVDVSGR